MYHKMHYVSLNIKMDIRSLALRIVYYLQFYNFHIYFRPFYMYHEMHSFHQMFKALFSSQKIL